jgi:Papain family cysteine protease
VVGPHLLGRLPSPPDERDWKLAPFLASDPELVAEAVSLLERTIRGYKDSRYPRPPTRSSNWGKALALLAQVAPTPTPPPPPAPAQDVTWANAEPVLDQGDYGTCVGNGWAQWGNTAPFDDHYAELDARAIYYESTVIGGEPDDPDAPGGGQQGSTVRDGAKAMQKRGRLAAYAFASSVDEVRSYVRDHGPIVMGTDWTSDMFNPDPSGYVHPTGSVEGGHCYLVVGDLPGESAFRLLNSWSSLWGLGGYFKMQWDDLAHLLAQGGEACAALELALPSAESSNF